VVELVINMMMLIDRLMGSSLKKLIDLCSSFQLLVANYWSGLIGGKKLKDENDCNEAVRY